MFKVKNRNIRTRCEICSKLTIKTPERRQAFASVFIFNFEQANADWIGFISIFKDIQEVRGLSANLN